MKPAKIQPAKTLARTSNLRIVTGITAHRARFQ